MHYLKYLIFTIVFTFPFLVSAQDAQSVFDRPGISDSPYLVDSNRWLFETGISASDKSNFSDVILPTIMLRKYIGWHTEARITYNYSPQMKYIMNQNGLTGDIPFAVGLKHKISKEHDYYPETSFIVNSYYPLQKIKSITKNNTYNLDAGFQFQSHLLDELALNYNIGTIFTDNLNKGVLSYSICITGLVHKNVEMFAEWFGYSPNKTRSELGCDAGVIYYPNYWSQIDFTVIDNIYQSMHFLSFQLGYSFCFDTKKR